MKVLLLLICLFVELSCLAKQVPSPSNQLTRYLGSYTTYSADFKQLTFDDKKQYESQGSGRIYIKRPGKFRWDQTAPLHQRTYLNGNTLTNYDQDLLQATQHTLKHINDAKNPAMLLTGRVNEVIKNYTVKRVMLDKLVWFELLPKTQSTGFQRVYFNFSHGHLSRLIVVNNLGERSLYTFSRIKVNQPLSDAIFVFSPPSNVDLDVAK